MKHTNVKKSSLVALMLVLTLVVGCLGALAMGAVSAATVNKEAPEITPKGEYDVWDGTTVSDTLAQDENGDYLIQSAADFVGFYKNLAVTAVPGDIYRLTCDIDISAKSLVGGVNFSGTLDGDGYTIKGAKTYSADYGTIITNLFGTLSGVVENLNMVDFSLNGARHFNALFGSINGTTAAVRNCHFNGTAYAKANGGSGVLAGSISGEATIEGVIMSGKVIRNDNRTVAIFAGTANNCTFRDCANYMTVVGTAVDDEDNNLPNNGIVSGFIHNTNGGYGAVTGPKFYNCTNYADITITDGKCAGFLTNGYRHTTITMESCTNYGNISVTDAAENSDASVGGIIAYTGDANQSVSGFTFDRLYNYGDIYAPGAKNVGGIFGYYNHKAAITIYNSANYGDITGGKFVGGIIGYCYASQWTIGNVAAKNSANYGDVTATLGVAGGYGGYFSNQNSSNKMGFYGLVLMSTVTGATGAGGMFGQFYCGSTGNTNTLILENSVIKVNLVGENNSPTGTINAISSQTGDNGGIKLDCTNDASEVTLLLSSNAPYTHYKADGTGLTLDLTGTEMVDTDLTDGTALTMLNDYATANSYRTWMHVGAPNYLEYFVPLAEFKSASSLNRTYNGLPSAIDYKINDQDSVKAAEIAWFAVDGETEALLDAAPVNAGSYRVKLVLRDENGTEIVPEIPITYDFTIAKATATVLPEPGTYGMNGTTLSVTYNGETFAFPAYVEGVEGRLEGIQLTPTVAGGKALLEPDTYTLNYSWAGNGNYEAATATYTLNIGKIQLTYPENVWTQASGATLGYDGTEKTVLLDFANEGGLFSITYEGNTATDITPEGTTLTATATVTVADGAHYELAGTAPTYTLTWSIGKGDVLLKLVDGEGNPVDLSTLIYDGISRTYYVNAYNAAGGLVANQLKTIVVLDAGTYSETVNYTGSALYNEGELTITYTVQPNEGAITLTLGDLNKTYDGNAVVPAPVYDGAPAGTAWDEVTYLWEKWNGSEWTEIDGAPTAGGTYRVKVSVVTVDGNYGKTLTQEFTIARATPTLSFDFAGTTYVLEGGVYVTTYTGINQAIAYTTTSDGTVTLLYNGNTYAPCDVGTYTVTLAVAETENYEALTATSITVEVKPFEVDLGDAEWTYDPNTFVYNGNSHTVTLTQEFLDKYAEYLVANPTYNNNVADFGTNTATVVLQLKNATNTVFRLANGSTATADQTLSLDFTVKKATIDVSGIYFTDTGSPKDYTGAPQNLTLVGVNSELLDVTLTEAKIAAGTYNVTATLTLKDPVHYEPLTQSTVTGTLVIQKAQVSFNVSGNENPTYNATAQEFTSVVLSDMWSNVFASGYSVTIYNAAGDVIEADEVVNAGTYTFVYEITDTANMEGDTLTKTMTIGKATYPTADYNRVTGSTTVVYDGEEHTLSLQLGAGLDGESIRITGTVPTYTDPGVYTITFELAGSANYNAIPNVEVTLTILAATVSSDEGDVILGDDAGIKEGWYLEVEKTEGKVADEDTASAVVGAVGEDATLQMLYKLGLLDENGEEVKASGFTVTIVIPEKHRDKEDLTFVIVTTSKRGKLKVNTFDDAKQEYEYDPVTGELTFEVKDLSATYGYCCKDSKLLLIVAIAGGALVLAAVVVVLVIVLCKKKKNKTDGGDGGEETVSYEEAPTEDDGTADYLAYEEAPAEEFLSEETPTEEAPVEEAPVEEAPVEEAPVEEAPVEEAPVEEAPVEEAPVEEAPVEEVPVEETPVEEAPVEEVPVEEVPVEEAPVEEAPVEEASSGEGEEEPNSPFDLSFEAKLALAPAETRGYYEQIAGFAKSTGAKVVRSWKKEKIYQGRNTLAIISFRASKLSISLALDPKELEAKYGVIDRSGVKQQAKTPALLKITSARRAKYAVELLQKALDRFGIPNKALGITVTVEPKTEEELLEAGLIKKKTPSDGENGED